VIIRGPRPDAGFVLVRNEVARDPRLSFRARGLLVSILSRPDNWETNSTQLAREAKEGRDAIRSALNELKAAGYLVHTKRRDEKGHWITTTTVYDTPQPEDGLSGPGESGAGESGTTRTTDTNDYHEGLRAAGSGLRRARADAQARDQKILRGSDLVGLRQRALTQKLTAVWCAVVQEHGGQLPDAQESGWDRINEEASGRHPIGHQVKEWVTRNGEPTAELLDAALGNIRDHAERWAQEHPAVRYA
jgi:hypothetical protein